MDLWVGESFDSNIYNDCSRGCGDSYWSPINKNQVFDKVADEGSGKRYYITWVRDCHYSVLVSQGGTIVSWRYETNNTKSCYIF